MKSSLTILSFLMAGIVMGRMGWMPSAEILSNISLYVLYLLMFTVGMSVGADKENMQKIRSQQLNILSVPLATIVGTFVGVLLITPLLPHRATSEVMAVGSGFGYYSLSSVLISQIKGAELGAVALTSNVIREVSVLLLAPLMVRFFGKIAPICAAGVTSVDTCLPIITQTAGKEMVVLAITNGILVDFTIPFFVSFFCSL